MKKLINNGVRLGVFLAIALLSSCLEKDLPAYPSWEGNSIDNVYVEHRYEGGKTYGDAPVVAYQRLTVAKTVDEANSTIHLQLTVPGPSGSFTSEERQKVDQRRLWMYFDVSTAAKVKPVSGTPKLGEPTDLTVPQKYEVIAANGDKRVWTIQVDPLPVINKYEGTYASTGKRYNFASKADAPDNPVSESPWAFDTYVSSVDATTSKVHAANANGDFGSINLVVNSDNTVKVVATSDTGLSNLEPTPGKVSTYDPERRAFKLYYQYTNADGTFRLVEHELMGK
ncbi:DUF5018-related domain-containing protein [Pontibacter chinhatensis]|uniref:Uncharacterized protein n=1 Tax=Pontibacter chinhatensis TaxID=1436961 RepID=A0A1I2VCS4_9BACT|nr:DUF4361 domain-containing protein [Pontibacter chinhatensis]SFG87155.1 protein of unknown function [Pontibacter chinhatensis]